MPMRDVAYLIIKPFVGKQRGTETLSRAVEHADLKDSAAAFTKVADATLEQALAEVGASRAMYLKSAAGRSTFSFRGKLHAP
jgi:anaerobic magnesium-protoporphyrin IX monomethyl ester cyclase